MSVVWCRRRENTRRQVVFIWCQPRPEVLLLWDWKPAVFFFFFSFMTALVCSQLRCIIQVNHFALGCTHCTYKPPVFYMFFILCVIRQIYLQWGHSIDFRTGTIDIHMQLWTVWWYVTWSMLCVVSRKWAVDAHVCLSFDWQIYASVCAFNSGR